MAGVCAFVGGVGGVLVALSIKYADSIMKTIATTGAPCSEPQRQTDRGRCQDGPSGQSGDSHAGGSD